MIRVHVDDCGAPACGDWSDGAVTNELGDMVTCHECIRSLTRDALRSHVSTIIRSERGGIYTHDAVCKACGEPLPWGEDDRGRVIIEHQAAAIAAAIVGSSSNALS